MASIEKKEILYAVAGMVFILAWFLWIKNLFAPLISGWHPFIAMLVYQVGMFIGLFGISSLLNGDTKRKFKITLIIFLIVIGLDIIIAPYMVNKLGVITTTADMWSVSTDAGFGALYHSLIGNSMIFGVSFVWILTYIITPILLILIIPILIGKPKEIHQAFP